MGWSGRKVRPSQFSVPFPQQAKVPVNRLESPSAVRCRVSGIGEAGSPVVVTVPAVSQCDFGLNALAPLLAPGEQTVSLCLS